MITAEEYQALTGELAPADFSPCEAMACETIHAHTLYAYVGRDVESLPDTIRDRLKLAVALQTQGISHGGGVEALGDSGMSSVSLGKFSYSGGAENASGGLVSPAASALLPVLTAYGRGLRKCDPSPCGC
ncbi:MAG: hypothetical protein SOY94_01350 [Candidatus Limiplasma sp.]|nr:hypothetical protein [Candidatus Limiplasma sp.]